MAAIPIVPIPRARAPTILPTQKKLLKRFYKEILADFLSSKDLKHCYKWLLEQVQYFASLNIGQLQRCFDSYKAEKILRFSAGNTFHLTTVQMCNDSNTCIEFGILSILTNWKIFFQQVSPFCGLPDRFADFLRRCELARALNITGQSFNHLLTVNDIHYICGFVYYVKKVYLPVLANEWYDFARQEENPKSGMAHRPDLEVGNLEFEILLRRRNEAMNKHSTLRLQFDASDGIQELIFQSLPSELFKNQIRDSPDLVPQPYVVEAMNGDLSGLSTILYRVFDLQLYEFYRKNLIFEGHNLFLQTETREMDDDSDQDKNHDFFDTGEVDAQKSCIEDLLTSWQDEHMNEVSGITSRSELATGSKEIKIVRSLLGEEILFCMLGANLRTAFGLFSSNEEMDMKFVHYVTPVLCSRNVDEATLLGLPTESLLKKQKNTDAFVIPSYDFFLLMSRFNSAIMGPVLQQHNNIALFGADYIAFLYSFVREKGLFDDIIEIILNSLELNAAYKAEGDDFEDAMHDQLEKFTTKFIQVYVGASMNDLQFKVRDSRAEGAVTNNMNFRLGTLVESLQPQKDGKGSLNK